MRVYGHGPWAFGKGRNTGFSEGVGDTKINGVESVVLNGVYARRK